MQNVEDLSGRKFGRLTVTKRGPNTKWGTTRWWCKCECGNDVLVIRGSLISGLTKSCGCLNRDIHRILSKNQRKQNTYDLTGEFGKGYTSKGEKFWFDKEDYDKIKDYCWYFSKENGYLYTKLPGTSKKITLHRLVMGFPKGKVVDHIIHEDFQKYDNRKSNLRICNGAENNRNSKIPKNNTSGVKGVRYDKVSKKWLAYIGINNKTKHLGRYVNKEDAIKARKQAEEKYFGEFMYKQPVEIAEIEEID